MIELRFEGGEIGTMQGIGTELTRPFQVCGTQTASRHFMEWKPPTSFHWGTMTGVLYSQKEHQVSLVNLK